MTDSIGNSEVLTPGEVAALFRVDPKTVARWAKAGRIQSFRTVGGHRRFYAGHVRELLAGHTEPRTTDNTEQKAH